MKAYGKLGFIKTDEQQEKNGIIYIPMERPFGKDIFIFSTQGCS
jgi:hypothetical protein